MNDLPKHPLLTKPLWTNTITVVGMMIGGIALLLLITFGLFSVVSPAANPYVDIVGYLILPGILAFGVFLMLVGILIRSLRRRRLETPPACARRVAISPTVSRFRDPAGYAELPTAASLTTCRAAAPRRRPVPRRLRRERRR